MHSRFFIFLSILVGIVSIPSFGTPKSRSIGTYTNGCLKDGLKLEPEGLGYQSVLFSKQRLYGHKELISYIKTLAKKVQSFWKFPKFQNELVTLSSSSLLKKKASHKGRWTLGIEDLSSQTGGPSLGNHNSHQNGLDADILFMPIPWGISREERERMHALSMVREDGLSVSEVWTKKQALLLQTAALSPLVERIFVNPVIKQTLCKMAWQDRSWLRKIRPWTGHKAHFHVRLKCPKDSSSFCVPQAPPKEGDGCGKELAVWFARPSGSGSELGKKPFSRLKKSVPKPIPEDCQSYWASTGIFPERKIVLDRPDQIDDDQPSIETPTPTPVISTVSGTSQEQTPQEISLQTGPLHKEAGSPVM